MGVAKKRVLKKNHCSLKATQEQALKTENIKAKITVNVECVEKLSIKDGVIGLERRYIGKYVENTGDKWKKSDTSTSRK